MESTRRLDKALARLQQPDTKMRRYRPRDAGGLACDLS